MLKKPNQKNLLLRLNRIEGQLKGIRKMIEEPRYCPDILTQISAVRRALDGASLSILEDHLNTCVSTAVKKGKGPSSIKEVIKTIDRFIR